VLQAHLAALALAAITLAASGCGGSKTAATTAAASSTAPSIPTTNSAPTTATSTTTTPTPVVGVKLASGKPLTRAQWLAKGDAICGRLNAQLAATPVKSIQEFTRVLPQAAAYERAELAQLVKLVPPTSKASEWQTFLVNTQQWAENSTRLGQLAQTSPIKLTNPLVTTTRKLHERLAHLAGHDGFKECSLV
jgi:hypothetical protein